MAALTVFSIVRSGGAAALVAAGAGGDSIPNNDGKMFLEVNNADGTATTVTIAAGVGYTVDGQVPTARTVSVAAGARHRIGPFPPSIYNDSTGAVNFTYSKVTSLTVQAVKLDPAI